MVTNRRTAPVEDEFYPTPPWGTKALILNEKFEGNIWEPACGAGHISDVLKEEGYRVFSSDLVNRGYGGVFDFLKTNVENAEIDNIVTNPPFVLAEEFLDISLKITKKKVCFLLRTAFLESKRRYENIFSKTPPSRVYVFSERLSMYPHGKIVKGGGTTSYSWFVFDKEDESGKTEIRWIAPGLKNSKE